MFWNKMERPMQILIYVVQQQPTFLSNFLHVLIKTTKLTLWTKIFAKDLFRYRCFGWFHGGSGPEYLSVFDLEICYYNN